MRRISVCLFLFAVAILFASSDAYAASKLKVSDIPTVDGAEFFKKVTAEKGKVVIVNVFASWCPPCRDEIPGLVNISKAYPEETVKVIGVSVDKEPKALVTYIDDMKMNYQVLLAKGDFIQRIRVRAVPQLLIYNKQGELVFNHQGLMDEADIKANIDEILAQ